MLVSGNESSDKISQDKVDQHTKAKVRSFSLPSSKLLYQAFFLLETNMVYTSTTQSIQKPSHNRKKRWKKSSKVHFSCPSCFPFDTIFFIEIG